MLHHTLAGPRDGPLVVFLHAVGTTSWMWGEVVAELHGVRALCVDLPGHGGSNRRRWVSLEDTAGDVAAVVQQVEPAGPVHLVGLSLGAYVGMTMLVERPDAYASAMLSGMHAGGMERRWLMKGASALMAPLAKRPAFARKTAGMFGATGDTAQAFAREAARTRTSAFRRASNEVVDYALPTASADIAARVLVVAGGREHPLIRSSLDVFAARIPACRTAIVPNFGHGWAGEDPALFAHMLRAHISDEPAAITTDIVTGA